MEMEEDGGGGEERKKKRRRRDMAVKGGQRVLIWRGNVLRVGRRGGGAEVRLGEKKWIIIQRPGGLGGERQGPHVRFHSHRKRKLDEALKIGIGGEGKRIHGGLNRGNRGV